MSIILKGIDLPKTGERVYAEIRPSGEVEYIAVTYDKDYTRSAKVERTNAIQIPKDHGNIIDESKAVVTETIDGYYEITAPTILEAED